MKLKGSVWDVVFFDFLLNIVLIYGNLWKCVVWIKERFCGKCVLCESIFVFYGKKIDLVIVK